MRKFVTKVAALVLMLGIFAPAALYAAEINVTINGEAVIFDGQGPATIGGRTMVPVRGVFEELGFYVGWDGATQTVTLTNDYHEVSITVNSDVFAVNGEYHRLEVPAQIVEGRTLLPIRAVLEGVGFFVDWDGGTNTVIITSASPAPLAAPLAPDAANASEFERRVFELVNIERANHGLTPLIWCDGLAAAARAHSVDMAENNMFGHIGSDGRRGGDRIAATNIEYTGWAENIGAGDERNDPQALMQSWMGSAGHRENILHPGMTHMGFGYYHLRGSRLEFYATQKFVARPQQAAVVTINASNFERRVFELTNAERANHDLPPLIWCDRLADAARAHSRDMAINNYFSHTGFDGSGAGDRIIRAGIPHTGHAENISGGTARNTPEAAMYGWLNSPGHRENILHPGMTHLGVGFYHLPGSQWEFYTTQKFAIPQ